MEATPTSKTVSQYVYILADISHSNNDTLYNYITDLFLENFLELAHVQL